MDKHGAKQTPPLPIYYHRRIVLCTEFDKRFNRSAIPFPFNIKKAKQINNDKCIRKEWSSEAKNIFDFFPFIL